LLVSGMIVYVSLLTHAGVIDSLSTMAVAIGAPLVVAIVLCYVIGVSSAFASSTALLTAMIPLSIPLLEQSSPQRDCGDVGARGIGDDRRRLSVLDRRCAHHCQHSRQRGEDDLARPSCSMPGSSSSCAPLLAWALLVPTGII
jgi:hypothetical protein